MRRRRRFLRDDLLAPWATLIVIVGLWWLGAWALGADLSPGSGQPTPREEPRADRRTLRPPLPLDHTAPRSADNPAAEPATGKPTPPADAEFAAAVKAGGEDVETLREMDLAVPVAGVSRDQLTSTFDDERGAARRHEAMDILAPRGTPVVAAGDGRIVKLFTSAAGGLTIYQFNPDETFAYYYAHLDRYAPNVTEGQFVERGRIIGYVGTTGNAPPGTPHLHFAIFKLGPEQNWWEGDPVDPFLVLR